MKTDTGLRDRNGAPIREGDKVEFFVEYDAACRPTYDSKNATRMVDVVKVINGVTYFWDEKLQAGAFAWRHASKCRIMTEAEPDPK